MWYTEWDRGESPGRDGMTDAQEQLYRNALATDEEWHAELLREYGVGAGTARYTTQGAQTPQLAQLRNAARGAQTAWSAESRKLARIV